MVLGPDAVAVIDSGYCTHAEQTLALVAQAADGLPVQRLLNTHLHSDHCGGNAALQARHPGLETWIPPGQAAAVRSWDPMALSYEPAGQLCPRFDFQHLLQAGDVMALGGLEWEVHAAPGHDPHAVILFEPGTRTLISADALWQNGFGVVFPELDGAGAFEEVAATLELIESLAPLAVIPGHGSVFTDVTAALERARSRLAAYRADPRRHAAHAAKVLLKFKLLELQRMPIEAFAAWAQQTPYFRLVHEKWFPDRELRAWLFTLIRDLVQSGAVTCDTEFIANA